MFGIPGGQNYRREARRGLREFPGVRHTRDTPFARASCAPYGPARPTIIRANEFRNFAGADVIWDNAHIACTPGTDSARLAPQPVSGQWRTSSSVNAIVVSQAAIGDTKATRETVPTF